MPKRRANGEGAITQRKDKNGKRTDLWQAQFTDFTGKRRTLYGKTQQEALKKMKEAQGKSDRGIPLDGHKVLFADWIAEWLEVYAKPAVKESTYALYHNSIHSHIIPAFPKTLLKDLRADMLQKFFNEQSVSGRLNKRKDPDTGKTASGSGGLSKGMLTRMRMLISLAMNAAIDNNMIDKNAVKNIKLPRDKQPEVEILSLEEQKRLEETVVNDGRPLAFCVMLVLYTGLRIGEVAALRISDIDFEAKELHVRRSVKRVPVKGEDTKTRIIISEPKTEKGKRVIPLPDFMVGLLKKHIKERNEYINVIAECLRGSRGDWTDEGYLFITQKGGYQEQNNISKLFDRLLERAGLKHIKFHALRHTFASRCIEAGFDVKTLSDILGHTDIKMTLRIYTHSLQEQKRKNMNKLAPLFYYNPEETDINTQKPN